MSGAIYETTDDAVKAALNSITFPDGMIDCEVDEVLAVIRAHLVGVQPTAEEGELKQLRGTVAALTSEAEARDKRDRNVRLAEAGMIRELVEIGEMLTAAGVQSHWDRYSGIATSTRVRLLIESKATGKG